MPERNFHIFFRTVYPIWKETVTSGHSAPYSIWGAVAAITVIVAPCGENYWVKLAMASIIPGALAVTSAYAAARIYGTSKNEARIALARSLTPKTSVSNI
jgi:hypothetical protein